MKSQSPSAVFAPAQYTQSAEWLANDDYSDSSRYFPSVIAVLQKRNRIQRAAVSQLHNHRQRSSTERRRVVTRRAWLLGLTDTESQVTAYSPIITLTV